MNKRISLKDLGSGLIFVVVGLAFGIASYGYDLGTAFRMGPGYFPLILSGVLCLLGVAIVVAGTGDAADRSEIGSVPLRGVVLLVSALVLFGLTIRGLGFVPALFLTVVLTAAASRHATVVYTVVLATAITAFCTLVFIVGLGVPLPLVGPWLRF